MKKITLRDTESNKEFCIVKRSYNLSNQDDQKWYVCGSQDLFNEDDSILEQLEEIGVGSSLSRRDGKTIYRVLTVGQ